MSDPSISLGVQWICDRGHWNGPGVVPVDLIQRPKRCQHMPFGGPYRACGRKVRDAELTARFVEGPQNPLDGGPPGPQPPKPPSKSHRPSRA